MKLGVIVPQGWTGEYAGVEPREAWRRTVDIARRAEQAGADSLWLFDHFHTTPDPTDEITFEAFTTLTALAAATDRAGLGHIVSCAGYRNPALQAKMLATMDVISGGRMTAGVRVPVPADTGAPGPPRGRAGDPDPDAGAGHAPRDP